MSESRRKVTFKLYPSKTQEALLLDMKGAHQRLYNAALGATHRRVQAPAA